jgi:hypothetical protein
MCKRILWAVLLLQQIVPFWVLATDFSFPYSDPSITANSNDADIWKSFQENAMWDESTSERLQQTFNVARDSEWDQRATDYIRVIINRFLAVVGLVALVVIIIGFYKMLVSWDSEAAWWDARKLVLNAWIALAVIGVAWFVVSWFFDIFFVVTSDI